MLLLLTKTKSKTKTIKIIFVNWNKAGIKKMQILDKKLKKLKCSLVN